MNSQESGSLGDIQKRFKLRVIHDALGLLTCVVVHVGTNLGVASRPRRVALLLLGGTAQHIGSGPPSPRERLFPIPRQAPYCLYLGIGLMYSRSISKSPVLKSQKSAPTTNMSHA